jgi:hypothetical protein
MKAALNGVPSLSVLDGWWLEGCIEGVTGWAVGNGHDGPAADADAASFVREAGAHGAAAVLRAERRLARGDAGRDREKRSVLQQSPNDAALRGRSVHPVDSPPTGQSIAALAEPAPAAT